MKTSESKTGETPKHVRLERSAVGTLENELKENGRFDSGVLTNVSLITRGEALGHGAWIDSVMLEQVVFGADAEKGVKSRFTHPGMSSDGLGKHLGRIYDVELMDDQVIGDLHFTKGSRVTPDGDLAEYVTMLAMEDPAAAGLSIVFDRDEEMELDFALAHGATVNRFGEVDFSTFQSPDPENTRNLPHVRLRRLLAADVVDEPAANPAGMFDRQPLPREVDEVLSYASGLTSARPSVNLFGVDPDRASQFLTRWLDSHGLTLSKKEPDMDDAQVTEEVDVLPAEGEQQEEVAEQETTEPVAAGAGESREGFMSQLKKYTTAFGSENGQKWFEAELSMEDAYALHCKELQSKIEKLEAELSAKQELLSSISIGESAALETGVDESQVKRKTFAQYVRQSQN